MGGGQTDSHMWAFFSAGGGQKNLATRIYYMLTFEAMRLRYDATITKILKLELL